MVFAAADHLMMVGHGNQIRLFIGGLNLIINRFGYRTENLMLQRFPMRMIAGTARSMGINVVGEFPNM